MNSCVAELEFVPSVTPGIVSLCSVHPPPKIQVQWVTGFGDWDGTVILPKSLLKPGQVLLPSCWKPDYHHLYLGNTQLQLEASVAALELTDTAEELLADSGLGAVPFGCPCNSSEVTGSFPSFCAKSEPQKIILWYVTKSSSLQGLSIFFFFTLLAKLVFYLLLKQVKLICSPGSVYFAILMACRNTFPSSLSRLSPSHTWLVKCHFCRVF